MSELDQYESEVLEAYERGELQSVVTMSELERLKQVARSTGSKNRRVITRLSTPEQGRGA